MNNGNNENEFPVPISEIDPELREKCACSDQTLMNWIQRYNVDDGPLAIKVAGQWRIFQSRLEKFLLSGGVPKLR